jgi:hypothetical protein
MTETLRVQLDASLPRPSSVLFLPTATDFSAPLDPNDGELGVRTSSSQPCITLLALSLSESRYCAGDSAVTLTYENVSARHVNWTLMLGKSLLRGAVTLVGGGESSRTDGMGLELCESERARC